MSREEVAAGLAVLGAAFNREITADVARVFHGVLGQRLEAEQWERAVRRALECESFFPPPAVLLRYGEADGAPQARAVEVYERVVRDYECGRHLGPREVEEQYGAAAMEAFVSAGGTRAFDWCDPDDEPFRRKAWVEAWIETTEQDPSRALPAGEAKRIGSGPTLVRVPKAEAAKIIGELKRRVEAQREG